MAEHIGVYPRTFDPVTNGHVDIIRRGARLVDRLVIAVAKNAGKVPLFTVEEHMAILDEEIAALPPVDGYRIEVHAFDTLLMHFAQSVGASVLLRGLRAISDFEYEFQMAGINARLNPDIDTVFPMASERHQFISSRFVKEIGRLSGDIGGFVSPRVAEHLARRFAEERRQKGNSRRRVQTFEG